jgi:hypothetical protein
MMPTTSPERACRATVPRQRPLHLIGGPPWVRREGIGPVCERASGVGTSTEARITGRTRLAGMGDHIVRLGPPSFEEARKRDDGTPIACSLPTTWVERAPRPHSGARSSLI